MGHANVITKLLKDRPHEAGAEIGVFKADTSAHLLKNLPDLLRLYCVDAWKYLEEYNEISGARITSKSMAKVEAKSRKKLEEFEDRAVILKALSVDAGKLVTEPLDFVFIDATHTAKGIVEDVRAWLPKVKLGGLLIGHDYKKRFSGYCRKIDQIFSEELRKESNSVWWAEVGGAHDFLKNLEEDED